MGRKRIRLEHTPLDNLISNLRAEVGEVISTWTLLETFRSESQWGIDPDPKRDLQDQTVTATSAVCQKLEDDIVARLSELGQKKIGRANFFFASQKLDRFSDEVNLYHDFVRRRGLTEKRNSDISHRELPERWDEHKFSYIPYPTIMHALASALILMKKIDRIFLGPSAPYLWKEMRKKRYELMMPLRTAYLLLPYLRLSKEDRMKIIDQETNEGTAVWTKMATFVNGVSREVIVNRKWGAVRLDQTQALVLDDYPLNELKSIETS